MEIRTLLKANIKYKKGSFCSVVILMLIIAMSLTAILSVQNNCKNSTRLAHEQVGSGELSVVVRTREWKEDVIEKVRNHPLVEEIQIYDAICGDLATVGEYSDGNSWLLTPLRENYRLLKEDLSGYAKNIPKLKSGEIYVPQGVISKLYCKVGDRITISTIGGNFDFTIKGFVVEPMFGASVIGWKQVFISDSDMEKLNEIVKVKETEELTAQLQLIQVYKAKDCDLSDAKWRRQINQDTDLTNYGVGSLTKSQSMKYTNLFTEIIGSILMVFIGFLVVVVLIIIGHSISTGIEMEYVNFGVLKAQGFSKGKLRLVILLQYSLAQLTGCIIGMLLAIPLALILRRVFQPITAIPVEGNLSWAASGGILLLVLAISAVFIIATTGKIGEISPVRAISGGKKEVYFDNRIKIPIYKKGLVSSLAIRQFTSSKRRYIGAILIVGILVFFMMTVNVLGTLITSKNAMEAMGAFYTECNIGFKKEVEEDTWREIEQTVEKYSNILKKYYSVNMYFSIDGEEIMCRICGNPESMVVIKGRAPLYENEIVITPILAEELDLSIGDEVEVGNKDKKSTYLISGYFQSMNDTGRVFAMSLDGGKKLGVNSIWSGGYRLEQPEKAEKITKKLNQKYGELLKAEVYDGSENGMDMIEMAINAMKLVIYSFSIIFAFVVVSMVCSKMFAQERKDIGIYKAMGFTARTLRFQFAVRFFFVAVIGAFIGAVCNMCFAEQLLNYLLRGMGITNVIVEYTPITFFGPVFLMGMCFFVFAYFVSRKVKKVEVRELIME